MAGPLPTGVRRERHGYRVYVRVNGELETARFPEDATIEEMIAWRKRRQAHGVLAPRPRVARSKAGTFAADAADYLARVAGMPTIQTRTTQITLWVEALGPTRDRRRITPEEVARQLATWQKAKHWSDATVNRHRGALAHLFTVLDGPGEPNPARQVPRRREAKPRPKGLPYETIRAILDELPDRDVKPKSKARSRAKACLFVYAYTGLPPAQQRLLTPDHLAHLDEGWFEVPERLKGQGVVATRRAVTKQGAEALAMFKEAEAWGGCANSTLELVFSRAAAVARRRHPKLHIPKDVTPYVLRHSFAELVARTTRSVSLAARLLGHRDERTTLRYLAGVLDELEADAAVTISDALPITAVGRHEE